jgi:hypothetical protein
MTIPQVDDIVLVKLSEQRIKDCKQSLVGKALIAVNGKECIVVGIGHLQDAPELWLYKVKNIKNPSKSILTSLSDLVYLRKGEREQGKETVQEKPKQVGQLDLF